MNDDRQGRPEGPTEEQIIEAVENSGLLLEHRVGDFLECRGWSVEYSWEYTDPDEGKSRELDILAQWPSEYNEDLNYRVRFHLLVECKQPRGPVVVLTRPMTQYDRTKWELDVGSQPQRLSIMARVPGSRTEATPSVGHYLGPLKEAHHAYHRHTLCKGVQLCKMVWDKGRWRVQTGVKSQLAAPLAKASDFHSKLFYKGLPQPGRFELSWPCLFDVKLCVAVLGSELYSLAIADGGPELERVPTMPMLGVYNSAKLQKRWMFDVVQFGAFDSYHDNVLQGSIDRMREALEELVEAIRSGGWPMPAEHFPV